MFRVIGTEEFDAEFEKLKKRACEGDGESIYLVGLIEKGMEKLKYNYKHGAHISRCKIPNEYREKYNVKSLWKLDLSKFWRMIYTLRGNDVEVISLVIEVLGHKKYDRKFGYKTS